MGDDEMGKTKKKQESYSFDIEGFMIASGVLFWMIILVCGIFYVFNETVNNRVSESVSQDSFDEERYSEESYKFVNCSVPINRLNLGISVFGSCEEFKDQLLSNLLSEKYTDCRKDDNLKNVCVNEFKDLFKETILSLKPKSSEEVVEVKEKIKDVEELSFRSRTRTTSFFPDGSWRTVDSEGNLIVDVNMQTGDVEIGGFRVDSENIVIEVSEDCPLMITSCGSVGGIYQECYYDQIRELNRKYPGCDYGEEIVFDIGSRTPSPLMSFSGIDINIYIPVGCGLQLYSTMEQVHDGNVSIASLDCSSLKPQSDEGSDE